MSRINYLDSLRGVAVLFMVITQTLHYLTEFNIWGEWWFFKYVNWVSLFMLIVGFSLQLAYEKHGSDFVTHVWKRFFIFGLVGAFLSFYCGFPKQRFAEVVSVIGFCTLMISPLFLNPKPLTFILSSLSMFTLYNFVKLPFMFNIFEILFYMSIGVLLCQHRPQKDIRKIPILNVIGKYALLFYVGHFLIIGGIMRIV